MSARSSASVSNSLAVFASSSSSGGSTFSLISFSVAVTDCVAPSSPTSNAISFSSPADMPSRPRSSSSTRRPPPSSTTTSRRDSPDSLTRSTIDDVALLRGPALDRRELGDGVADARRARGRRARTGSRRSAAPTSSVVQSATSTFGWTVDGGGEAEVAVGVVGELVVVLGRGRGPDPRPGDGAPVPAADMALDRLRVDAVLADARDEHGHRHLALAEAGDLQGRGQIGRRVLDRVTHVRARHVDAEADLVGPELLDTRLHEPIQADRFRPTVSQRRGRKGTKSARRGH